MSGSVNSVVLVGRLTRDPELQTTASGLSTVWFTVACDRPKKKDEEGQTDFISCRAWRQQAEFLSQYGAKGSLVSIQGNIQTGSYQDKEGRTVYTTTVQADRIQLLESKSSGQQRNDYPCNGTSYTRDDISRDLAEGFNTGPDAGITNEDLPF